MKTFEQCQQEYDNRTPDEPPECPSCGTYISTDTCYVCHYTLREYDPSLYCDPGYDGILGDGQNKIRSCNYYVDILFMICHNVISIA